MVFPFANLTSRDPTKRGCPLAAAVAILLLLVSYRVARVFDADELAALRAVPVPLAARMARFLAPERS